MNTKAFLGAMIAVASFQFANSLRADSSLPAVTITSISASDGQVVLHWSGGRPTYQLQTRADFSGPWVNLGAPTSNTVAFVPVSGAQAFFRVVPDATARYQVVFNATWSQATHPAGWTTNAHWSGLVGGTHNSAVHFFRAGELATEGIRQMAEFGAKPQLLTEVGAAMTNGTADFQLSGSGLRPSPGSVSLTFPQPMRRDYPLVTLVSMIAPSPDWFAGVDSLSLIENDQWLAGKTVTLYSMDAGTDSGLTYEAPDQATVPHVAVMPHTGFPALQNGVIVPFGTFTFTRLD